MGRERWEGRGVQHQDVMHADSLKNIPNMMTLISAIRIAHLSHRRSTFGRHRHTQEQHIFELAHEPTRQPSLTQVGPERTEYNSCHRKVRY